MRNAARIGLVGVPVAIMAVSGAAKALRVPAVEARFVGWGYPWWFSPLTGAIEVTSAVMLARRRTAVAGGLLAGSVLAGAVATHVQHGEYAMASFPAAVGALVALATWRRAPALRRAVRAEVTTGAQDPELTV